MNEQELLAIEQAIRKGGHGFTRSLATAILALVADARRRCSNCKHWTPTDTEVYANYGKCAFWHRIARPRRSGAGPIRTRDGFFCGSYETKEVAGD